MKIKLFNLLTLFLALSAVLLSIAFLMSNKWNAQFSNAASLHLSHGSILIAFFQIRKFKEQNFYSVLIMSLLSLLVLGFEQVSDLPISYDKELGTENIQDQE